MELKNIKERKKERQNYFLLKNFFKYEVVPKNVK